MNDDRRDGEFEPSDRLLADTDLVPAGGPRRLGDDPLLRLFAVNWLIGAAVAVVLVTVVLVTDTAHLRSLIMRSSEPWIGMILLVFGFLVTMCSVAIATAVMLLPKDDDDDGPGGGMKLEVLKMPAPTPRLEPIPVRVVPSRSPRR